MNCGKRQILYLGKTFYNKENKPRSNNMNHKFIVLVNGRNESGDEYDSYDDALNAANELKEGAIAGYDDLMLMGDADDSEIFDPDSFEYEIVELDEHGNEVNRYYL